MDVFNAPQDRYIGSVVRVWRSDRPMPSARERGAERSQTGAAKHAKSNPSLTHEEGHQADPTQHAGHKVLGESLGPFPTAGAGNTGPQRQSAEEQYATGSHKPGDVVLFAVRPGRMNLGPLTPPLYVPVSAVHSVSLERVVLDIQGGEIPQSWRQRVLS
jgi:hypothetical protein